MKEIRILINSDSGLNNNTNFLSASIFKVDERDISAIGHDSAADTLSEYDAIIIDCMSPIILPDERIKQLFNFLKVENNLLIYILNRYKTDKSGRPNTLLLASIVNGCKGNFGDFVKTNPSGSTFQLTKDAKKNLMYDYLNSDKKTWKISFVNRNYPFIIPLATNSDEDIVSFSIRSEKVIAKNAFVPNLLDEKCGFWQAISEYLISIKTDYEDIDEWVRLYSFPKLDEIKKEITNIEKSIASLEENKSEYITQKQKFERIRNTLLYHSGDLLKDVCKEVFNELGINAVDGKRGREDIVFVYDDNHYLVEVKSSEKSTSKTNVRQLNSHVTEYKNENEIDVKGILLINAWRKLPIEERGTVDKPIFPPDIMNLVNLSAVVLMTTQQLFVMYCEYLEEKFDLNSFIKSLQVEDGIIGGFNNVSKYKLEQ